MHFQYRFRLALGLQFAYGLIDVYVGAARASNADTNMVFRKEFAG